MAKPKIYQTDEERKAARAAYMKRWRADHRDERAAYKKQWHAENRAAQAAYMKQWRADHKEHIATYYQENKEERLAYMKQYNAAYYSSIFGRAVHFARNYKRNDIKYNRGECTITPEWIVENLFSGQVCQYCGESDWHNLGCDRIDNTKPHTPDNVRCCCEKCNKKKGRKSDIQWLRELWSECMLPAS